MAETCDQSWPGGLPTGLDVPCLRPLKHTGQHQNQRRSMMWSGKMTQAERERREQIRAKEMAHG